MSKAIIKPIYYALGLFDRDGNFNAILAPRFHTYDNSKEKIYPKRAFTCFYELALIEWSGQFLAKIDLAKCFAEGFGIEKNAQFADEIYEDLGQQYIEHDNMIVVYDYLAHKRLKDAKALQANNQPESAQDKLEEAYYYLSLLASDEFLHVPSMYRIAVEKIRGQYLEKDLEASLRLLRSIVGRWQNAGRNSEHKKYVIKAIEQLEKLDPDNRVTRAKNVIENHTHLSADEIYQTALGLSSFVGNDFATYSQMESTLYQIAAKKGSKGAMYQLGWCYHKGLGKEVDLEQALYWYQQALTLELQDGNQRTANDLKQKISDCETTLGIPLTHKIANKAVQTVTHGFREKQAKGNQDFISQLQSKKTSTINVDDAKQKISLVFLVTMIGLIVIMLIFS